MGIVFGIFGLGPDFEVVPDGLVMGGLGIGQGPVGFGQVLTKVLQVLAKGFPIFYLEGVSYEGRCWTKKFKIWPGPENPKHVPQGPGRPPDPPKRY